MDKEIKLEGAPSWYGTTLEQLDFEWSREEELELERYCQKILKNIADEEMTPCERFEATMAGREKDRLLIEALYFNLHAVQTLDSAAFALKPLDICLYPKLLVKAHLATVARFALDFPTLYPISYTHEFRGGRAQMTEYGNPRMIGDAPIKSVTDLEGIGVPDPYQAGLYPGYLWACREMKRAFIKYGVDKVMPLWVSIHDPIGTVMESMLTYKKALDWFPAMCEQGAVGSGSFCGWFCAEMDYKEVIDFSREHDLYCSCALSDRVLLNGPISAIEEEIKQRCEYGKSNPKFAIGIAAVAYLTPISNFEAAIATAKRYGKLWEAQ